MLGFFLWVGEQVCKGCPQIYKPRGSSHTIEGASYLELDYTPDLYSNFVSGALPRWLSLCRLFLYLYIYITKQNTKLHV